VRRGTQITAEGRPKGAGVASHLASAGSFFGDRAEVWRRAWISLRRWRLRSRTVARHARTKAGARATLPSWGSDGCRLRTDWCALWVV
jgi:hypothetical protein